MPAIEKILKQIRKRGYVTTISEKRGNLDQVIEFIKLPGKGTQE